MVTRKEILLIVNKTIKYYGLDDTVKPSEYEKEVLSNQIFEEILEEITEEVMDKKKACIGCGKPIKKCTGQFKLCIKRK